jgi:hypothetical protein
VKGWGGYVDMLLYEHTEAAGIRATGGSVS